MSVKNSPQIAPLSASAQQGETAIAKAGALKPWLREQAGRIEQNRAIPEDVVQRLVEADLFRMTQPARYNGLGYEPDQAWQAIYEVAGGCSSCAWVAGLTAANVFLLTKCSEQAQQDIFMGEKPAIISLLTGGVGYDVKVEPCEGGIMLSGKWRYASGIDVASWAGLLVDIPGQDGGASAPHIVFVPQENFTIDHQSWNVLGMRGTGSKNIALEPCFVPAHRFMSWAALQAGEKHPDCPHSEIVYDYPINSMLAMSIAAPTLGVASAVADEFKSLVQTRVNSGTRQSQIDDQVSHIAVASSAAAMSIMCEALLDDARAILQKMKNGAPIEQIDRAHMRMRISVASRLALAEAQHLFEMVGGSLLPQGSRMERLFRDLHAMSSHFLLQKDAIGTAYGRLLLGLDLPPGARL